MTTIERLRALLAEATPGPWAVMDGWDAVVVPEARRHLLLGCASDPKDDTARFVHPIALVRCDPKFNGWEAYEGRQFNRVETAATAALIAAAINALPALLDVAEAARAYRESAIAIQHRGEGREETVRTWRMQSDAVVAMYSALARLDGTS